MDGMTEPTGNYIPDPFPAGTFRASNLCFNELPDGSKCRLPRDRHCQVPGHDGCCPGDNRDPCNREDS